MCVRELCLHAVVPFFLGLYHACPQLCHVMHKSAYNTIVDVTHASTSTKHGVMLAQKPTGEHHMAPARDFHGHYTDPRDKSCMLNLQTTIWAAETMCHEHITHMRDRQTWPHTKGAARQGGRHKTCVNMMERTDATTQHTTHSDVVACMVPM